MGKGDRKTKRGKISMGTSGVRRQKKKVTVAAKVEKPAAAPKKKAPAKKAAPKKATAKKTTTKKTAAKKTTAKKTTTKKATTKKKAED